MYFILITVVLQLAPHIFSDVHRNLVELGKSLTERLKDPENQGREFLADLQAYIGQLYEIYENVTTQDWDIIKEGIKAFDAVNQSGNALHFKTNLDFRRLKEKYYWSYDDRVLHARDLFNETEVLWNKVVDRINYVKF
jgi:hypothetical protein